jgi:hypothetical protein
MQVAELQMIIQDAMIGLMAACDNQMLQRDN